MTNENNEPREKTRDEVIGEYLDHLKANVDYWETLPGKSSREKLNGLVHSMLVDFDGEGAFLTLRLVTSPHPSDKQYHVDQGENYFPEECDIAGDLHDRWGKVRRN